MTVRQEGNGWKKSFVYEMINKEMGNGREKLRFFLSWSFVTEGQDVYFGTIWGKEEVKTWLVILRPSYKVNCK